MMNARTPRAEIADRLKQEFGTTRTVRTITQQYARYFGVMQQRKIAQEGSGYAIPRDYYVAKKEWEQSRASEIVVDVPPMPEAPPTPMPEAIQAPTPAPLVVWNSGPTKLRLHTTDAGVEAEVVDADGGYLVSTTYKLGKILGFLRGGANDTIHVEIVGKTGSSLTDTKRTVDEIVEFLVG